MMQEIVNFFKEVYKTDEFIPLHEPRFMGNEKKYLNECIDSTFVSSVGRYVGIFEKEFAHFVGSKYAVATVNGTSALHISLLVSDVREDDEVITQPLTFVATCNSIAYVKAHPVFVDVDLDTMGMSPECLKEFLQTNCQIVDGECINKKSKRVIKACIPMHTFGHPCKIDKIKQICEDWNLALIEDSAESLGSYYQNKHTGTFGELGAFSFNGNKIITSGGGGVIITDNEELAKRAKHLTTTAKIPHTFAYDHDSIGYNYRMPNLNAALLVAQMEQLESFCTNKRETAKIYENFFKEVDDIDLITEPLECKSNYWLQTLLFHDKKKKKEFLEFTNKNGVMTRPIWKLMNELDMFKSSQCGSLENAKYLEQRVVNIPSSVRL